MRTLSLFTFLISITALHAEDTVVSNLPAGWAVADIGTVRKPGAVSYDAGTKAFTISTIAETAGNSGTFAYTPVKGDFVAT